MKYTVIAILLALVVSVGYSQEKRPVVNAQLVKTHTTFTATSDDTTGFITSPFPDLLSTAEELILEFVATDSISADIYLIGSNSILTGITETYADSLIGTSNSSNVTRIVLKDAATNRLEGLDRFKIGVVFRASGQGTTAGRTLKSYVWYKPGLN